MDKTDVIERLMRFHLSRQEALIYLCLIEHGQLTGYEASKLTGVSRSNVYGSLSTLVDKGAAMVQEAGNPTYYNAVGIEEFLDNQLRSLEKDREYLLTHMPKMIQSTEGYLTIQGANNILDKAFHMISGCEMRLYLAASGTIVEQLKPVLKNARKRGLKIVIISDRDYWDLATSYYEDEADEGQIRLITDSTYVLTGELTGSSTDTCLYSGQENLVTVMKEALRNKIRLLEIEGMKKEREND
ncbi:MAG: TrmB family transcriptional regulator [Lachnospiraceae bacterium]|nr:TrmB family transcriptional regulator [Lachnospiraceae bacterium]